MSTDLLIIEIKINNVTIDAAVDTAAGVSTIKPEIAESLDLPIKVTNGPLAKLPNNTSVKLDSYVETYIDFKCKKLPLKLYLLEGIAAPILLGLDWCNKFKVTIKFDKNKEHSDIC